MRGLSLGDLIAAHKVSMVVLAKISATLGGKLTR
jgi:hypothetical protein